MQSKINSVWKITDNIQKNFTEYFANFPQEEYWRLFMDRNQQKEGWQPYEQRDPGCLQAMQDAWIYIQQTADNTLDKIWY